LARQTLRDLRRRRAERRPKLRILAVSEGAKTEGLYLSLFVRELRAANVQIDVLGRECGSDPLTVVEFARERFLSDRGYDLCYCVIDRDNHPVARFNAALQMANALNSRFKNRAFISIVSDPCIEFWFLLHFVFCRAPFVRQGAKSRADCAIAALKVHLPRYSKNDREGLSGLIPLTDQAIENAKLAVVDALATGESNPSTNVHEMISRIIEESRRP
jgi:hypothetical protein